MTPVELDVLADKVAERLNMPLVSAAIPGHVGELLAKAGSHGGFLHSHWIPLSGPYGIQTEWTVAADGALTLRLRDCNGYQFWQGTFRSIEEKP